MAQITITFNGTSSDLNDFVAQYNYQDTIPDPNNDNKTIPNPESKLDFFIRKVKEFVYESVKAVRVNRVGDVARKVELEKVVNF